MGSIAEAVAQVTIGALEGARAIGMFGMFLLLSGMSVVPAPGYWGAMDISNDTSGGTVSFQVCPSFYCCDGSADWPCLALTACKGCVLVSAAKQLLLFRDETCGGWGVGGFASGTYVGVLLALAALL